MIPLSTAVFDPKWYHMMRNDKNFVFFDKNHVINGLRVDPLVPNKSCESLCKGPDNCKDSSTNCQFLTTYQSQLNKINFKEFIKDLSELQVLNKTDEETYIVFIFHEAYDNPCSERWSVRNWFKENNYLLKELFIED